MTSSVSNFGSIVCIVVIYIVMTAAVDGVLLLRTSTSSMAATAPILNHRYHDYISHINRVNENRRRENKYEIFSSLSILPGGGKHKE